MPDLNSLQFRVHSTLTRAAQAKEHCNDTIHRISETLLMISRTQNKILITDALIDSLHQVFIGSAPDTRTPPRS